MNLRTKSPKISPRHCGAKRKRLVVRRLSRSKSCEKKRPQPQIRLAAAAFSNISDVDGSVLEAISSLPPPPQVDSPVLRPKTEDKENRTMTLVLDLDETLVHSTEDPNGGHHFEIEFLTSAGPKKVFVKRRPLLERFLGEIHG